MTTRTRKTHTLQKITALTLALLMLSAALSAFAADGSSRKLDTYYSLAVGYINKADYDKAMEYLDAALKLCTEETAAAMYADLHLKKGCVYTIRREYGDAQKELDEAIRVNPELAEAWLVKVQAYSEDGKTAEAAESLEKYIALSGDTSLNETLAQFYLQLEDRQNAEASYRKLAESVTEDPDLVSYNLAVYEMGAGMYAEALESLKQCRADPEKVPGLHYNTGVCQMMVGNYAEAVEAFTASLESENFRSDAAYNRAICSMSLAEYRAAIEDFTTYIDGLNDGAEVQTGEATATDLTADTKQAVDTAHYYRGVCFLSAEDFDAAAADFTLCIENGINEKESTFNRGVSLLQAGRYEEAKADLTACVEKDYMADDALFYRSYAERALGDNEAALADLTLCIEHAYNLGQTYQERAGVYQAMGDDDNYLKDLEASLDYLED
jgi:tetratricopeptide (TPR) repeat protein